MCFGCFAYPPPLTEILRLELSKTLAQKDQKELPQKIHSTIKSILTKDVYESNKRWIESFIQALENNPERAREYINLFIEGISMRERYYKLKSHET